jgi:hypothetical protein
MSGAGNCGPCPNKKSEITGVILDEAKDIQAALSRDERRLAFIGGLCAKAEVSHLKKIEALVILQGTLAEMLSQTIPGLQEEADKVEPGSIARFNADLMVEIAKEVQREALNVIDHAMANSKLIIMPR